MATEPGCVVVGAGLAGANLVQELREQRYPLPITLIGDETDRPYERPPLSKEYLQGKADIDTAFVHEPTWYADNDVTTAFGETATGVDRAARTVATASGTTVPYRHLVLATGATPRTIDLPGGELRGVHTLRRIADSNAVRSALQPDRSVVVIGAGWIGLEVAAAARLAGCRVTVAEAAPLPLQRVMGDRLGRYFAELHRSNGVQLRTGAGVEEIVGDAGVVTGVRIDGELVPADLVLVGVGVTPNTALAESAGLAVDNGVLVDERLRTDDPAVLAAGDLANATNTTLGRRIRVEHWDNAIRHGKLAAATLVADAAGREPTAGYDWLPYFFTDQFDLGMEYVGHAEPRPGDQGGVVIRGDLDSGEFIAFWVDEGTVRAAMNVNIWDVNDDLRALVGRDIAAERLADPSIALTDL